jgi:hypothetical protein
MPGQNPELPLPQPRLVFSDDLKGWVPHPVLPSHGASWRQDAQSTRAGQASEATGPPQS